MLNYEVQALDCHTLESNAQMQKLFPKNNQEKVGTKSKSNKTMTPWQRITRQGVTNTIETTSWSGGDKRGLVIQLID